MVRAVDELWRSRILREVGGGYDFSHDLLRDAAYAHVSPPRRWLLHRRVAQGLELLHADDPDSVSAQLAEQYARGGRADRAVGYYRGAAAVASSMFAHDEAIRLHEAALDDRARAPGRAGPDEPGARPLGVAGQAADRPLRLCLAAGPGGAGAINRPGGHARAA